MPSAFPSRAQVEMLLKHLEERRWLTARHSRTLHARDRTRAAWQEVAAKLNSDRSGCIKSWKQWSKYWMDKKSAVKKKATQTRMARQQTGGGEPEEGFLSALEEKILAIMDGKNFVTGDKKLENGLHVANEPGPSVDLTADVPNADESDDVFLIIQDVKEEANATPGSESIHEIHLQLLPVEQTSTGMPQTEQSKPSIPELQPGPSWQYTNMPMENQPNTEQMFEPRSPPAVPHKSNAPITSSSPCRRRTARRRLIQTSPTSQRGSQMASLTERFVAIEERRLANERLLIENQQRMLETFKEISESWSRQTQALQDLCASIRRGS